MAQSSARVSPSFQAFMDIEGGLLPFPIQMPDLAEAVRAIPSETDRLAIIGHLLGQRDLAIICSEMMYSDGSVEVTSRRIDEALQALKPSNPERPRFIWSAPTMALWLDVLRAQRSARGDVAEVVKKDVSFMLAGRPVSGLTLNSMEKAVLDLDLLGIKADLAAALEQAVTPGQAPG